MGTYEFDGEKNKKASKHQKEWGNRLISGLELSGDEIILDLGCGDGVLTEQLSELTPRGSVLGIDASLGMVKTAKKLSCENLEFVQMGVNFMDFEKRFDLIFSNAALHWIIDHKNLLERSYKALKPNGKIAWNFAGGGTCSNFFEVIREKMKSNKYAEYFKDFEWPWFMPSKAEYIELIKSVNFSKAEVSEKNEDRFFADKEEMIRWIDQPSIVPFIKQIPDELKEEFRSEVVEEMISRTIQPDGRCFETFRRINVTAVK